MAVDTNAKASSGGRPEAEPAHTLSSKANDGAGGAEGKKRNEQAYKYIHIKYMVSVTLYLK